MIGQIVPWKNHDMFIRSAQLILQKLPHTTFAIIGADLFGENTQYASDLKKRCEHELPGKVLFPGHCPDMPALLEGIDVVLHPAGHEPFGRSILEAMAMSVPVVAIDACGPAEILTDGEDGILVKDGDAEAMANAALRLLTDAALAKRLCLAARKKVEASFMLTQHTQAIEALYSELLREDTK